MTYLLQCSCEVALMRRGQPKNHLAVFSTIFKHADVFLMAFLPVQFSQSDYVNISGYVSHTGYGSNTGFGDGSFAIVFGSRH